MKTWNSCLLVKPTQLLQLTLGMCWNTAVALCLVRKPLSQKISQLTNTSAIQNNSYSAFWADIKFGRCSQLGLCGFWWPYDTSTILTVRLTVMPVCALFLLDYLINWSQIRKISMLNIHRHFMMTSTELTFYSIFLFILCSSSCITLTNLQSSWHFHQLLQYPRRHERKTKINIRWIIIN